MRKKVKRCNLCGAKLSGDICSECGYNNAAYTYDINEKGEYCTHSSTETFFDEEDHWKHMDPDVSDRQDNVGNEGKSPQNETWDYSQVEDAKNRDFEKKYSSVPKKEPVTYGLNKERRERRRSIKKMLIWLVLLTWGIPLVIEIIIMLVSSHALEGFFSASNGSKQVEEIGDTRLYGNDDEASGKGESEIPIQGDEDKYVVWLGQGIYIAGLQLPLGTYDIQSVSGYGTVRIWNNDSFYWDTEFFYEEDAGEKTMEDVPLTLGTVIRVNGNLEIEAATRDSDGFLDRKENALTESVEVKDGMIVGKELPAGTYRAYRTGGEGRGSLIIKYASGNEGESASSIEFSDESEEFENLVLTEGSMLMTLNCEITLEPAEYDLSDYADDITY